MTAVVAGLAAQGAHIRVAVIGLGAIGREVIKAVVARRGLRLVSAADPAFAGRDAGELSGIEPAGVAVSATIEEALQPDVDVALVLTTSGVVEMLPVVEAAAARTVDVVSTCEDLAYADFSAPDVARRIDSRARAGGITVLGI